jgi:hypothetical protein
MCRANILGLSVTSVEFFEKRTSDGQTIYDISFLFYVFSITFVRDIFRSDKYVERYARGSHREACRSSYKIVVKISSSIIRHATITFSQSVYPFVSSSYLQTDELKKSCVG